MVNKTENLSTFGGGTVASCWPHGTLGALPDECVVQVLVSVARPRDVLAVAQTCRRLYALAHDDHLWHLLFALHGPSFFFPNEAPALKQVPKGVAWHDQFIFAAQPERVLCYSYGDPFALRVVRAGGSATDGAGRGTRPRQQARRRYLNHSCGLGREMDSSTRFTVEPISSHPQKAHSHLRHPVIDGEPLQLRLCPRWAEGPPPAGRWAIEQQRASLHHQASAHHSQAHDGDNHRSLQQRLILFDSLVRLCWIPTTATTSDEAQPSSSTAATAAGPGLYLALAPEGGQPLVGPQAVRVTDEPALAALFRLQPWCDRTTRRPRENQPKGSSEEEMDDDDLFGLF